MKDIVLCLCDLTGTFAEPWVKFGYTAVLIDPQHSTDVGEGQIVKVGLTLLEAMPLIHLFIESGRIAFVAGFPPCTDVAVSGARWWEEKAAADPYFQAKASLVAEQCRTIGELSGAPWFFENPVSAFSRIFGPSSYSFDPYDYSAYCEEDQYFKKTCLWTGGGFIMPSKRPRGSLGQPDQRIFKMPGNDDQANLRSATPFGFSVAVFFANCPMFAGQALPPGDTV